MNKLIKRYRKTIRTNCIGMDEGLSDSVRYWQNSLFASTIEFVIPLSIIALAPGIIYCFKVDLPLLALFDALTFIIVLYIAFGKGISVETRKLLLILCTYFVASFLLIYIGVRGPGLLFLYAACIFAILILPTEYAYWWSAINLVICCLFSLVLHYEISPEEAVNQLSVAEWIAISSNLIFLSFISSALLPRLFAGLSGSFDKQKELQKDLYDKKKSLENALQSLQQKNSDLEQFAHIASHDLQEPLRTISNYLTNLENRYGNSLDDKARLYIRFAVDGAKHMRQVIIDLLEFSKAEKNIDTFQRIDISEIVKEVCLSHQKLIDEKGAVVRFPDLPIVVSNRAALVQIFLNLIGNALKYSRDDVKPEIDISVNNLPDHWLISVRDNGIGIEQEYFDKIFLIFQRLHSKDKYSGTGLGLAIVKKMVENLGGRIWLESEPEKGSTFYFIIPMQD